MSVETSKTEKSMTKKTGEKKRNRIYKNYRKTTKKITYMQQGISIGKEREKRTEATGEAIMMENLPQINVRH